MKRWQTLAIGILISAAALFLAYRQANVEEMLAAFRGARYGYVLLGFALVVALTAVRGLRWHVLTEGRLPTVDGFWLFNIGFLFNNILPARLGEIVRAILAGRRPGMHVTSALSSIVVERLFDMVSVVALFGLVLLSLDLPPVIRGAGTVMGLAAVTGIVVLAAAARRPQTALRLSAKALALLPRLDEQHAHDSLAPFIEGLGGVSNLRTFVLGLLLSLIAWLMSGVVGWVMLIGFVPGAPLIDGIAAVASAGLGISVPAAPSGVGPFHAAVIVMFEAIGYDTDLSRSYAFVLHAANFIITSLVGVIGLLREGVGFREMAQAARTVRARPASDTPGGDEVA